MHKQLRFLRLLHRTLNVELKKKLPIWYSEITNKDYYLVLTNDMDSYYSCRIIQKNRNIDIGGFYSFEDGLYLNHDIARGKEPIYVDLSISRGKAFDNHYTFIQNSEIINPNVITQPYFRKYCGGTLPLVAVLFDDYESYSEYQWETILAVDSFYYGFYNNGGAFRAVNIYWYNMLEITDYVVPILENRSEDYFTNFKEREGISELIHRNDDGTLICNRHIELPQYPFEMVQPIKKRLCPKREAVVLYEKEKDNIMVSNETYCGKYVINFKT